MVFVRLTQLLHPPCILPTSLSSTGVCLFAGTLDQALVHRARLQEG